jgi:integrase
MRSAKPVSTFCSTHRVRIWACSASVRALRSIPVSISMTVTTLIARSAALCLATHCLTPESPRGLGSYQLGQVSHPHIEAWIKRMADQPLAPATIKTRYNNVRGVFRAAVRDRLIARDPTEAVRLPRQRRADASMTIPSIEDVGALASAADDSFRAFVALCAFAGIRLGEAAAIQVADIDFLRRQLTVARQVQRAGDRQVEIKAPKYGSERVIYLPDELATLLAQHVEKHTFGRTADRWMFQGEPGDPPHQNTVGYWWRKAKTAAGVSGVRLHDLRHFYASGLIAAGCDVVTVQRALGHASATTTLRTYAHLWPTAEDRTRAAAADLMRSATSGGGIEITTGPRR